MSRSDLPLRNNRIALISYPKVFISHIIWGNRKSYLLLKVLHASNHGITPSEHRTLVKERFSIVPQG